MRHFHPLTVTHLTHETADSVRVRMSVPQDLRDTFHFLPGQHVTVELEVDDERLRRTYSICSQPGDPELEIGVRMQPGGRLSGHFANGLRAGDTIHVLPPVGRFHVAEAADERARLVVLFAAGSGITPILSILTATLERDENTQVLLFYGNRTQRSTMFIDDLFALKNRYPERLALHFVFSREDQEFTILDGRLDGAKTQQLWQRFVGPRPVDAAFVCGPDSMIEDVSRALEAQGLPPSRIHSERFGAALQKTVPAPRSATEPSVEDVDVTVVMDGHRRAFSMHRGDTLVDGAAKHGVELPFSCKGGVCATCRCHLRSGRVQMDVNYGLEPWEVEDGYILACQSRPESDSIELDYDRT